MTGFLFDRDFDAELETEARRQVAGPKAEAAPPDPAVLAAEREALVAAAFAEGHAAGQAEAEARVRETIESEVAQTLSALRPEIEALVAGLSRHRAQSSADLARMCHFLAQALLPEILERFGARRIEAFCRRAARMAEGPEGAEIRLPPALLAEIGPRLGGLSTASHAPVRLVADPALRPGEARAQWRAGRADYAAETLHAELLATLSSIAQPPAPDGQ